MSEKPRYVQLLNALSISETIAHTFLEAWIAVTRSSLQLYAPFLALWMGQAAFVIAAPSNGQASGGRLAALSDQGFALSRPGGSTAASDTAGGGAAAEIPGTAAAGAAAGTGV